VDQSENHIVLSELFNTVRSITATPVFIRLTETTNS